MALKFFNLNRLISLKTVAKMEKEEIIFSHNQGGSIVENMIKNVNIVVVY